MESPDIPTDHKAERRQAFWRGFKLCAILLLGTWCLYQCSTHWSQLKVRRTEPARQDVALLSSLLSMPQDSNFEISRFESWFRSGGPDSYGATAAAIKRTSQSPSWEEMLKEWEPIRDPIIEGRVSKTAAHIPWLSELLNNYQPPDALYETSLKYRRPVSVHRSYLDHGNTARVLNWPFDCEAFFLPNDKETLYICADGNIFLEDSVISFEQTTSTLVSQ